MSGGEQAVRRDGEAQSLLVELDRRFRGPLKSYFEKRIRERYDVDDLVQEVFIRLARRAGLDDISNVDAYVFQTAASVIRDRARSNASRRRDIHEEFVEESHHTTDDLSPEHVLLVREELDRVVAALSELPARTRDVFILCRYENLTQDEIAKHLDMTSSGVRYHLMQAKAHLARRLEADTE